MSIPDSSKTGGTTYQLWKLEPPVQSHNSEIIVQSQSGQSGSTVIEDIGAHENDFDMMLYDEPSGGQDNQNDIVHTDKGNFKKSNHKLVLNRTSVRSKTIDV